MYNKHRSVYRPLIPIVFTAALFCVANRSQAQSFSSGSTGADGDLIINTPGVTVLTLTPQGGGTVFNFKSIQIAAGATLRLSGQIYGSPLFFLAQNAVTIGGTIDLNGANGYMDELPADRAPSTPGAGGFSGGVGNSADLATDAEAGNGPGGGVAANASCPGVGGGGTFTGNSFLVPLVGGSGGGGGGFSNGGGAGGGALLIASSTSVTLNGTITANGGTGAPFGGRGSGGAIRLAAPIITGSGGTLTAQGGPGQFNGGNGGCRFTTGGSGIVRVEAFQNTLQLASISTPFFFASPFAVFLPAPAATLRVTSVGGVTVPASPTGSFTIPDVVVNSAAPLVFAIQASNIPVGTAATLTLFSENGPDQILTSTPLSGTLASSTATATATLASGYSRGYVKAIWTQ